MKLLLTTLFCMLLAVPAWADQQTTVLAEPTSIARSVGNVPVIDGSNDAVLEKKANAILKEYLEELVARVGHKGTFNYAVQLNRPSLVSILLQANNQELVAYKGVNLDLTTGKEFQIDDFFVQNEAVEATLGSYEDVLFAEQGLYTRTDKKNGYTAFVPYGELMESIRIGEAGRLVQITKLTHNVKDKVVTVKLGDLLALKLDSNPSTGYRWQATAAAGAENSITNVGSSFIMPRAEEARVGSPGTEILMLTAQTVGTHKVLMEYKRPWERTSLESFSFTVVVKE